MESPDTVINAVPLILEIPLMGLLSPSILALIIVPLFSGLNVLSTRIGMFFMHTGYIVGGYTTLAPKLHSSVAST
jgi:hypothetical protein